MISLLCDKSDKNGNGFWKFNSSLVYDEVYVEKMKKKNDYKKWFNKPIYGKRQTKWEFLKYEIRKFNIDYLKIIAKKGKNRGLIKK